MKYSKGSEVFEWPEFRAFMERLGVDLKLSTTCLTITLPRDGTVRIAQDTRGAGRDFSGYDRHLSENRITAEVGMFRSVKPSREEESNARP